MFPAGWPLILSLEHVKSNESAKKKKKKKKKKFQPERE